MRDIAKTSKKKKVIMQTSIIGLLGIGFVILKLLGVINWSWWWVLLPFYGGLAIFLGLALFALIVAWLTKD